MHFWMIKYVSLEPIFFAISLDIASSSKVFISFDDVFLSIVLLKCINKFNYFNKKKKRITDTYNIITKVFSYTKK